MTAAQTLQEDWIKTRSWDLPTELAPLLTSLGISGLPASGQRAALHKLTTLPAWQAAPDSIRRPVEKIVAGGALNLANQTTKIDLSKLTSAERKALPSSAFVFPKARKFPIHDRAHAIAALRLSGRKGPKVQATVRAAVRRRYPGLTASLSNADLAEYDLAITPGGRVGDASSLAKPGYTGGRKLSDYEREVAHALMRKRGIPRKVAIVMARGIIDRAAKTGHWGRGKHASAAVRAGAVASVAQRKSFSNERVNDMDLAVRARWKHGWIPENALAVAIKEKHKREVARLRKANPAPPKIKKMPPGIKGELSGPRKKARPRGSQSVAGVRFKRGYKNVNTNLSNDVDLAGLANFGNKKAAPYGSKKRKKKSSPHGRADRIAAARALRANLARKRTASMSNEVDLAGHWKHGYIPLDAAALAEKEHRKVGTSPGPKAKTLADYRKTIPAAAKKTMTQKALREHAQAHAAAAGRARTPASKKAHATEAAASLREIARRKKSTTTKKTTTKKTAVSLKKTAPKKKSDAIVHGSTKDFTPKELADAINKAKAAGDEKRIAALKTEVKRRVAKAKALQAHARKAQELIDTDWKGAQGDPAKEKKFFAKLTKLLPGIKPKLDAIRNSKASQKLKDVEYFKTFIEESVKVLMDHVLPHVITVAASGIGMTAVAAVFHGG